MSQSKDAYDLNQQLPYITAKCKRLEKTLHDHKITIPQKSLKPVLYRLFYFLCQKTNYSIIPTSKKHLTIDAYIALHTVKNKKSSTKRKNDKTKPPKKRIELEPEKSSTDMEDNSDGDAAEFNTMEETDNEDEINEPLRTSTPTEIISIDDDIYENNKNQLQISFDEKMYEKNSKHESISLDDDIYN